MLVLGESQNKERYGVLSFALIFFSPLEIHFVFLLNEFREGTYTRQASTIQSPRKARGLKRAPLKGVLN